MFVLIKYLCVLIASFSSGSINIIPTIFILLGENRPHYYRVILLVNWGFDFNIFIINIT